MHEYSTSTAAARPSDLKLNNRIQILEAFKSGAVYSVADLARDIGISRQTVMKAIQFFLEKGIIVSDGKAESGSMGGKRAELFTLSANRFLFNVLICSSCLYISLFNYKCEIIDEYIDDDILGRRVNDIMDAAIDACDLLLIRHGIEKADVRGVCLTCSGIVERESGLLRFSAMFPTWGKDVPISEKLSRYFGDDVTVITENVARVCGSSSLHDSQSAHTRVASVFSRWDGVGACLMDCGHILYGKDALIGEIGHMILEPGDTEICACGSRGCFERQVSASRLRKLASEWAETYPSSPLLRNPLDRMTIRDMFAASAAGDALAQRLSGYAAIHFSRVLRNLTLLFNPDEIIFQGDYAYADDCFMEILYRELRRFHCYVDGAGDDNPFRLRKDIRSIQQLTTLGAYTLLIDRLFSSEQTYS